MGYLIQFFVMIGCGIALLGLCFYALLYVPFIGLMDFILTSVSIADLKKNHGIFEYYKLIFGFFPFDFLNEVVRILGVLVLLQDDYSLTDGIFIQIGVIAAFFIFYTVFCRLYYFVDSKCF